MKLVESSLRFFAHVGFGGDSSTGKNHFDIEIEHFNFPEIKDADGFISLSLYHPAKNELEFFKNNPDKFWYELERRKGKLGGQFVNAKDFWKRSLLMFKRLVFASMNKNNYGKNVIVKEKNKEINFTIQQFGYAFNLPIKIVN